MRDFPTVRMPSSAVSSTSVCLQKALTENLEISPISRRRRRRKGTVAMTACVYLRLPSFTCVYLCLTVFTYVYLHLPAFTCVYLRLPAFICVYLRLHVAAAMTLRTSQILRRRPSHRKGNNCHVLVVCRLHVCSVVGLSWPVSSDRRPSGHADL